MKNLNGWKTYILSLIGIGFVIYMAIADKIEAEWAVGLIIAACVPAALRHGIQTDVKIAIGMLILPAVFLLGG